MKEVNYKINVQTKGATKEVDGLNKSIKKTGDSSKETQNSLNTLTGGAVSRFSALKTNVLGVVKSFKSLRVAIIASGIGALVLAVVALGQAFTRSEAGQNKFAKILGVIGSITGNLLDLLADLGEKLISVFTNPKEAIMSFVKLIRDNVVNRFEGLLELIPKLGKAINLLFKGQFSEAGKVATNAVGKVVLGVEDVVEKTQQATEATKDFIKELEREANTAAEIADKRAKADKIERANTVERAKADREIADLRFKAEQRDLFTATERIKFLEDASALEEKITNQEIEAARLRFEAKSQENKLTKSTTEDLNEQAQLEAQLIGLETSKLRLQKRLQTSITTFRNEEKALRDAARKEKEEEANEEIDNLRKVEAERNKQLQKQIQEEENVSEFLTRKRNTDFENELLTLVQQYDKRFELARENAELEKELFEQQRIDLQALTDKYDKIAEDNQKVVDDKKIADERQLQQQKVQMASEALGAISQLVTAFAGKDEEAQRRAFNINKAISIGQAIISTAQGIIAQLAVPQDALTGLNFVKAGIVAATGAAQVATISQTKFQAQGGSSPSSPSATGAAGGTGIGSQAPAFNVVGQSGFNQVAQALGQQNSTPIKAFVVSGDVTSAQALENNIIDTATF